MRDMKQINVICIALALTSIKVIHSSNNAGKATDACSSFRDGMNEWLTKYGELLKPQNNGNGRMYVSNPKEKVRVLGKVLKCYVHSLRATWNQKVELIFVIDSSSSIGERNFIDELKFVKKLLSDFTVDSRNTRVSVITFSSKDNVLRHVDHLTNIDEKNHHKCSLLDTLQRVGHDYRGGGTYTLGGLLEAQAVIKSSRDDSKKAIFLITDGHSNFGSPVHVSEALKNQGIEIFTFGIENGNTAELFNISSEPKVQHTYILDSFREFEALARRALHEDLHGGEYLTQSEDYCGRLCAERRGCCDRMATCSCGTHTGKYECACMRGYYGSGLRGECKPCPPGTYKNSSGPGDVSVCTKCPDRHHESPLGSTSVHMCKCAKNYHREGPNSCAALTCPTLRQPDNGYFVSTCSNVINAGCGMRCNPGYVLKGSSIRWCQENGRWNGEPATCSVKKCRAIKAPRFGHMLCTKDDFSFETSCQFSCYSGFKLYGSKTQTCLAIGYWSGVAPMCKEVRCKEIAEMIDGRVDPPSCTEHRSPYGQRCTFECNQGYRMIGPYSRQCTKDGLWTPYDGTDNRCTDIKPPRLLCPHNVELSTDDKKDFATADWQVPIAIDNSGYMPMVTSLPVLVPPTPISIGNTTIEYIAEDSSGNKAKCKFTIEVKDTEPPQIDRCISPPPFIRKVDSTKSLQVQWDEPIFSDNSNIPPRIKASHKQTEYFDLGTTQVVYSATDRAGNTEKCIIKITVEDHPCTNPRGPNNGDISCSKSSTGLHCKLFCEEGYGFAMTPANSYTCNYETASWEPEVLYPFPDCSVSRMSNNIVQKTLVKFRSNKPCHDGLLVNTMETVLRAHVSGKVSDYCEPGIVCSLADLRTECVAVSSDPADIVNDFEVLSQRLNGKRGKRSAENEDENNVTAGRRVLEISYAIEGALPFDEIDEEPEAEEQEHLKETVVTVSDKVKDDLSGGQLLQVIDEYEFDFDTTVSDEPTFTCHVGSMVINNTCVNCPKGFFFNIVSESCEPCSIGKYQPEEGKTNCEWCPPKTSTSQNSSKFQTECKGECKPGTFSDDGLEDCETCPIGTYQPGYSATECLRCPENSTTEKRGAWNEEECGIMCQSGQVSKSGLEPCFPCPRGYFQPSYGKSSCYVCPDNALTEARGSTTIRDCTGITDSSIRNFNSTPTSELFINRCFEAPCQNDGVCQKMTDGYKCECKPGWTGLDCEIEINECEPNPCSNNATCNDLLPGFNCTCEEGYEGVLCEHDIDECASSPCENNATCHDSHMAFSCLCENGFTGMFCEEDIDDCALEPCGNGTCLDGIATFTCNCSKGFTGENCELEEDECMSSPCHTGSTCLDEIDSYRCLCPEGMTGEQCEHDIDECASNPCLNGGKCMNQEAQYTCRCLPRYSGINCQTELESNYDLHFNSSGVTDYSMINRVFDDVSTVSIGVWIRTDDDQNYGTILSYANDESDNALSLTDYTGFTFYINGENFVTDVTANDDSWHHIFLTWTSEEGSWEIYKDAVLQQNGTGFKTGAIIKSGGTLVIGQEQDKVGGDFYAGESFLGSMTRLQIWNKTMTESELNDLVHGCSNNLHSDVVAWADFIEGLMGKVIKTTSHFCKGCKEPETLEHGTKNWTSLTIHSTAVYRCNPGYEMQGVPESVCRMDSTWSNSERSCQRMNCGFPGMVAKSNWEGDAYYGDIVTFKCFNNYKIQGSASLQCTSEGKWNATLPKCVEVTCPRPQGKDGVIIINTSYRSYKPGHTLRFKCRIGRKVFGPDSIKCTSDGVWSGPVPSCTVQICYNPPNIPNGRSLASADQTFTYGDVARYQCDSGYEISGNNTVKCESQGKWDNQSLPQCGKIRCELIPNVTNAVLSSDGSLVYEYGSSISYECTYGFKLKQDGFATCSATGNWNTKDIECIRKHCRIPISISFGNVIAGNDSIGSVMFIECDPGYTINGSYEITCLNNEQWSEEIPTCIPVECAPPPEVPHANHSYELLSYRSKVIYECEQNYELEGDQVLECDENGTWTTTIPTCLIKNCSTPNIPMNGRINGEYYHVESKIFITCLPGYTLRGASPLRCLDTQEWDEEMPECEEATCPDPESPDHGSFNPLEKYLPGEVVTYECDSGYELDGKNTRTCRVDGTWTGPVPVCLKQKCESLNSIMHGKVLANDISYGSTAAYQCDSGYAISGPATRVCGEGSTWTGLEPQCDQVLCPPPLEVPYATISGESRAVGSTYTYECDEGYEMKGYNELTCTAEAEWNHDPPVCEIVQCHQPTDVIANGRMVGEEFTYGSTIHYVCDDGYYTEDSSSRTCQANGTWDSGIPECQPVECGPPVPPDNGKIDGFEYKFKKTILYTCDTGYKLSGILVRVCQADKTWSGSDPTCALIECERPENPVHGNVTFQGLFYNDEANYQCDSGYVLQREAKRTCTKEATWSGKDPTCEIQLCGTPPEAENAEPVLSDRPGPGKIVEYKCNFGYSLAEESTLTCTDNGNYSGNATRCVKVDCGKPDEIQFGRAVYNGTEYGDTAIYECELGYEVRGDAVRECQGNARWSGEPPFCEELVCPKPLVPAYGTVQPSNSHYELGIEITYSCDEGYTLVGEPVRTCLKNGTWSTDNIPECTQENHCPRPIIENGYVTVSAGGENIKEHVRDLDEFVYGLTIDFACEDGFQLKGLSEMSCLGNGSWSGDIPVCERKQCPQLEIAHGNVEAPSGFAFDKRITFVCDKGYKLEGNEQLYCQADGSWSDDPPKCSLVLCSVPSLDNGTISILELPNFGFGYPYGITLEFKCRHGFQLTGANVSTCDADGVWTPEIPFCSQSTCNKPRVRNLNGLHIINDKAVYGYRERLQFDCNEGYELSSDIDMTCLQNFSWSKEPPSCKIITCPSLKIAHGKVYTPRIPLVSHFTYGINVFVRCENGYGLVGSRNLTCQANKTWSDTPPECVAIRCSEPNIPNSEIEFIENITDYIGGSKITISCEKGYEFFGSESQLMCRNDGSWNGEFPECGRVQCPYPYIPNGMIEDLAVLEPGSYGYGDTIRFSCYSGFYINGRSVLDCTDYGTWSFDVPTCEPVVCDSPLVENGRVIVSDAVNVHSDPNERFVFGTFVETVCDQGYYLTEGDAENVCEDNGQWSIPFPVCDIYKCSPLDIDHALPVNWTLLEYGEETAIYCEDGYQIQGDSQLVCGKGGRWKGEIPVCKQIQCTIPNLENGRYTSNEILPGSFDFGDKVEFSCDEGFYLDGPSEVVCNAENAWSEELPNCKRITCAEQPVTLINGQIISVTKNGANNTYEGMLIFNCEQGYSLLGATQIECQSNGEWSGEIPTCNTNYCPVPFIENGDFRRKYSAYTFGHSVRFSCDPGFLLEGEVEIVCTPFGNWSGNFPTCTRLSCEEPVAIENGRIIGNTWLYEDTIEFVCNTGYQLNGQNYSTCQSDGLWSSYPRCVRVTCPLPSRVAYGQYMVSGFKYEDTVQYSCEDGFKLVGQADHVCQAGRTWSGDIPSCSRVSCPDLPVIINGYFDTNKIKYLYQDSVTFKCNMGYIMQGSSTILCMASGQWSEFTTRCDIVRCEYPVTPLHGMVYFETTFYNSLANYSCSEGYILEGENYATCTANGHWSGSIPTCTLVFCPEPDRSSFANGYVIGNDYNYGDVLQYRCSMGYELRGNMEQICKSNGQWSGSVPNCLPVDCRQPNEITNGQIIVGSTVYSNTIRYRCDLGYDMVGSAFRTCLFSGKWSGKDPSCEIVTCPTPNDIENGYIIGSDYTYQATITYVCHDAYSLYGESTRTCSAEGRWSGKVPYCRIKKCAIPDSAIQNHVVVIGNDFSAGATIHFRCDAGYRLIGDESSTCYDGLYWTNDFPHCDRISCGLPSLIDNAVIIGSEYEYEDIVTYKCVPGYVMTGDSDIRCLATGQWSAALARCDPVRCEDPPEVANGIAIGDNFTYNQYVYYKCDIGYELNGNNLLQCNENGQWRGQLPTCQMISCGTVPVIFHASTSVAKTTYGSKASYKCNRGYLLEGHEMVECLANGTWYPMGETRCVPVDCGTPPIVTNGNAFYNATALGERAEYVCKDGYLLKGSRIVQCKENGEWNFQDIKCEPIVCLVPLKPRYGYINGDNYTYGSEITYHCDVGYVLEGAKTRICQRDSEWSTDPATCKLVYCDEISAPPNAMIVSTGNFFNSEVKFICDQGFHLVGSEIIRCTEHGIWSTEPPSCIHHVVNIPCPTPQLKAHMLEPAGPFKIGDTVAPSCEIGYRAVGNLNVTCTVDLSWTNLEGSCEEVYCAAPVVGRAVLRPRRPSYPYATSVRYMCPAGLFPKSTSHITCQADGTWDEVPGCEAHCAFQCHNGGRCIRTNTCKCVSGWAGRDCTEALCPRSCQHGGTCTSPYTCTCAYGYTGHMCESPVCPQGCDNGGTCVAPDRCSCKHGFRPPTCQPY